VVMVIESASVTGHDASIVVGDASEPDVLARADLETAVGVVAGTDNDTTNLSVIAAARRINSGLFVAARQNEPASAPLFAAMRVDSLLVPAEVVAHEVYAQLSTPLLWRFLQEMPARGDEWAAQVIRRLTRQCGRRLQALWKVQLTDQEAPALRRWLPGGEARLGDLLRSPEDRDDTLHAVALLALRGDDQWELTPGNDFVLAPGDQLLFVGRPAARRSLDTTITVDSVFEYVAFGREVPASWVWRRLARRRPRTV
jgi:voltage-gated potassium channel